MKIKTRDIEPFYFPGNEIGCLLIHGFTGSPGEMRPLGEFLRDKGYTVQGIRLPGHGTNLEDMVKTSWQDWYHEVRETYTTMASSCQQVFLIGLSMGGALALNLAADTKIRGGIVPICAPIFLSDKKAYAAPFIQYFKRFSKKRSSAKKNYDGFWYDQYPTRCVASLVKNLPVIKKELKNINLPALVIQSKLDKTVEPRSAQFIYDNIASKDKKVYWLENSGHVVTLDTEREQVFLWVHEFINRVVGR